MAANEIVNKDKQELQAQGEPTKPGVYFTPSVDIYENEDAIVMCADMPGVNNENVDIRLEDNQLRIHGRVANGKIGDVVVEEYRIGDYVRTFTLSGEIEQSNISATMKDGVLCLELPKAEAAKPRKIAVKSS